MNPEHWFWRGAVWLMLTLERLISYDDHDLSLPTKKLP